MAKVIAILGASSKRDRFANKAVRAYLSKGYQVYPIHPTEESVEGLPVYRSILDIPDKVDIANFYVRPETGEQLIEDVAKKGVKDVYLNPGAESDELYVKARELGLNPMMACSILAIGINPSELADE